MAARQEEHHQDHASGVLVLCVLLVVESNLLFVLQHRYILVCVLFKYMVFIVQGLRYFFIYMIVLYYIYVMAMHI